MRERFCKVWPETAMISLIGCVGQNKPRDGAKKLRDSEFALTIIGHDIENYSYILWSRDFVFVLRKVQRNKTINTPNLRFIGIHTHI